GGSAPGPSTSAPDGVARDATPPYKRRVRVLVIGASGQLGRELVSALPAGTAIAPDRSVLDLDDAPRLAAVLDREHPDVVVNCAADNRVDAAETDPAGAFRTN